jgi:hypothetical protein
MVKYGIWIRISVFPYFIEKVGSHSFILVLIKYLFQRLVVNLDKMTVATLGRQH